MNSAFRQEMITQWEDIHMYSTVDKNAPNCTGQHLKTDLLRKPFIVQTKHIKPNKGFNNLGRGTQDDYIVT